MKEVLEPPYETRKHNLAESPLLKIHESSPIQKALIEDSGIDPAEWIEKYAARFRELIENSSRLRDLVRENQELAKLEIKALLEERPEETEKAA